MENYDDKPGNQMSTDGKEIESNLPTGQYTAPADVTDNASQTEPGNPAPESPGAPPPDFYQKQAETAVPNDVEADQKPEQEPVIMQTPEAVPFHTQEPVKAPEKKTGFFSGETGKKRKKTLAIIFAAIVLTAAGIFTALKLGTPIVTSEKERDIYLLKGQDLKAQMEFTNKSGREKNLILDFGDKYDAEKYTFSGDQTRHITFNLGEVNASQKIEVGYGMLSLKKVNLNVYVADPKDLSVNEASLNLTNAKGNDLTGDKYCAPGETITFKIDAENKSGGPFKYTYDMKVNGKKAGTAIAKWDGKAAIGASTLSYQYTFNRQGRYAITIGDAKFDFICTTKDPTPANGTVLTNEAGGGMGQLKVENKYAQDIIVNITNTANAKSSSMVIKAKNSATLTGVSDGTYKLTVKTGSAYSNAAKDFVGKGITFSEPKTMKFVTTSGSYSIWNYTFTDQ